MVTRKKKDGGKTIKARTARLRSGHAKVPQSQNYRFSTEIGSNARNISRRVFFCSKNASEKNISDQRSDVGSSLAGSSVDVNSPDKKARENNNKTPLRRPKKKAIKAVTVHAASRKPLTHAVNTMQGGGGGGRMTICQRQRSVKYFAARASRNFVKNAVFVPGAPHLTTTTMMALRKNDETPRLEGNVDLCRSSWSSGSDADGDSSDKNADQRLTSRRTRSVGGGVGSSSSSDGCWSDAVVDADSWVGQHINPVRRASDFEAMVHSTSKHSTNQFRCSRGDCEGSGTGDGAGDTTDGEGSSADADTDDATLHASVGDMKLLESILALPAFSSTGKTSVSPSSSQDPSALQLQQQQQQQQQRKFTPFSPWDGRTLFEDEEQEAGSVMPADHHQ